MTKKANSWNMMGFKVSDDQSESTWKPVSGSFLYPTKKMCDQVTQCEVKYCTFDDGTEGLRLMVKFTDADGKPKITWMALDLKSIKKRKLEDGTECDITTLQVYDLNNGEKTIRRCDIQPL
jgi:hypothetical protein